MNDRLQQRPGFLARFPGDRLAVAILVVALVVLLGLLLLRVLLR